MYLSHDWKDVWKDERRLMGRSDKTQSVDRPSFSAQFEQTQEKSEKILQAHLTGKSFTTPNVFVIGIP